MLPMLGGDFMKQLVLIRHGESEWNRLNLFTGWTDVELTDKGLAEAHEAGRQLKAAGFDFESSLYLSVSCSTFVIYWGSL